MARFSGLLIGAGFGLLFVLLNTGRPVDPTAGIALRVLAVAAFTALVVAVLLLGSSAVTSGTDDMGRTDRFGAGYWIVVAVEVLALFGGFQLLRILDAPEQAGIAWVAIVVGLHLVAFLWVWQQRSILVPGVLLTGYGGAGLVMASTSAVAWVPLVSGVLSGLTLLACGLVLVAREYLDPSRREPHP